MFGGGPLGGLLSFFRGETQASKKAILKMSGFFGEANQGEQVFFSPRGGPELGERGGRVTFFWKFRKIIFYINRGCTGAGSC